MASKRRVGGPGGQMRERLAYLVKRFSQSEIARKTGISVSNICYYLNGRRMPADLCALLVDKLGVNPAWLLSGQGEPYLTDVAAQHAPLSQDVQQLVLAMEALERANVGSLLDRPRSQDLVEFHDALAKYDSRRESLKRKFGDAFKWMLKEIRGIFTAPGQRDFERALALKRTADKIAKLCDDPVLILEYDFLCSTFMDPNATNLNATELRRSVFLRSFAAVDTIREVFLHYAHSYAHELEFKTRHLEEARRVYDVALTIGQSVGLPSSSLAFMGFRRGCMEAQCGNLQAGFAEMSRYLPQVDEQTRQNHALPDFLEIQLQTGLVSFEDALAQSGRTMHTGVVLMRYATWLEVLPHLRATCREFLGDSAAHPLALSRRVAANSWVGRRGKHVLEALDGKGRQAIEEYSRHLEFDKFEDQPANWLNQGVAYTQICRIAGEKKTALLQFEVNCRMLERVGPKYIAQVFTLGTHHRNALELVAPGTRGKLGQAREAAKAFFKEQLAKGYHCFKELAARE